MNYDTAVNHLLDSMLANGLDPAPGASRLVKRAMLYYRLRCVDLEICPGIPRDDKRTALLARALTAILARRN